MKAVMYHYVRRHDPELPYFTYLDFDSFRRQLDWFESVGRLASREEFEEALERGQPLPDVFVPTFDDGLVEHAQLVAHELERRGTFGVFFVPTAPLETGCILDVHRIHLLLGRHGGGPCWMPWTGCWATGACRAREMHGVPRIPTGISPKDPPHASSGS
ncbi:hypothetical protein [Nitratidesulfovibrio liaohensis]|uniref:hypothetical protein n=1 Tax=Nitratidesulfovibrio liaohensis TaxID=2604158 RepID=UPI0031331641